MTDDEEQALDEEVAELVVAVTRVEATLETLVADLVALRQQVTAAVGDSTKAIAGNSEVLRQLASEMRRQNDRMDAMFNPPQN